MTPSKTDSDNTATNMVTPVRVRMEAVRWEVRSQAVADALDDLLRQPDHYLTHAEHLFQDTCNVTLGRVTLSAEDQQSLLLRRNNYGKPAARWRDCFRTAGPLRAFRIALDMERAGLPVARVLAAGIRRSRCVPQAGYLVVQEVPNAVTLAQLARRPQGLSRVAIRSVVGAIVRLHEAGFVHGDLTINNILLDDAGNPWFIDLERTRRLRCRANWRQSVEDYHRFARHYRRFSPAGRMGALRLLREYCAKRGWGGRERKFINALANRLRHKVKAD